VEQLRDAVYVEIDNDVPGDVGVIRQIHEPELSERLEALDVVPRPEEETTTVEGEPNVVIVGPARPPLYAQEAISRMSEGRGRIGSVSRHNASMMGLLLPIFASMDVMERGSLPTIPDAPAPEKKCLVCRKLSPKPFCCGDHARAWKEYKKAERSK
jgi:hypothetical protein